MTNDIIKPLFWRYDEEMDVHIATVGRSYDVPAYLIQKDEKLFCYLDKKYVVGSPGGIPHLKQMAEIHYKSFVKQFLII
jgi:hypothetical protein